MEILNSDFLRNWREKLGVSQKRIAELAKVSLATLRQFEIGGQKPQGRTLEKITELVKKVDEGVLKVVDHPPVRRGRKKGSGVMASSKLENTRLNRENIVEETLPHVAETSKRVEQQTSATTRVTSGRVQLSNIDLELINRILIMSNKEKIALLSKLL